MRGWFSALLVSASLAAPAHASPGVVVLVSDPTASSAFVESVRIQLTGMADVTLGPSTESGTGPENAARARRHLLASSASIAVWQERRVARSTGKIEVVVLAVTRESRSSPIEVARLSGESSEETDRILALKVGELLHQVLTAARSERELARELEKRAQPPTPARSKVSSPPARADTEPIRFRGLAEAGGGLRVDTHFSSPRVGVKVALGAALQMERFRAELALDARRLTDLDVRATNGSLVLREVDVRLGLRALWERSPLAFGAGMGLAANAVGASAVALDERRGSATKAGLSVTVGPELRLRLAPVLEMRTQVVVEQTVYDQRFAIEGVETPSSGTTHVSGELSLVLLTR